MLHYGFDENEGNSSLKDARTGHDDYKGTDQANIEDSKCKSANKGLKRSALEGTRSGYKSSNFTQVKLILKAQMLQTKSKSKWPIPGLGSATRESPQKLQQPPQSEKHESHVCQVAPFLLPTDFTGFMLHYGFDENEGNSSLKDARTGHDDYKGTDQANIEDSKCKSAK